MTWQSQRSSLQLESSLKRLGWGKDILCISAQFQHEKDAMAEVVKADHSRRYVEVGTLQKVYSLNRCAHLRLP